MFKRFLKVVEAVAKVVLAAVSLVRAACRAWSAWQDARAAA